VAGARPASNTALISSSAVTFTCTSPDVTVDWSASNGRAYAGRGYTQMFANSDYAVLLHEFGHIFGLGDTYVEGVWTCQPGQENSVMCGSGGLFTSLQRDDLNAIQEVFCLADLLCHDTNTGYKWIAYANASGALTSTGYEVALGFCNHSGAKLKLGEGVALILRSRARGNLAVASPDDGERLSRA
jgi:hypothetical protein